MIWDLIMEDTKKSFTIVFTCLLDKARNCLNFYFAFEIIYQA